MHFRKPRNCFEEWVNKISVRMSGSLSAVTLVLMILGTYVLLFSSISLLYKVIVVVYIFVLLFLFTLALQSLETIGKTNAELRSQSQKSSLNVERPSALCSLLERIRNSSDIKSMCYH